MITNRGGGKLLDIMKAHRLGWVYSDYKILDIRNRKGKFLTNRDYCSLHPLNGKESAWIDDKLTLKYILSGTKLGKYMPEYYFQIENKDRILALTDCPIEKEAYNIEDIIVLLETREFLALKKYKASLGDGFIKAQYDAASREYKLNGQKYNREELKSVLNGLKDYLVIELLRPHPVFARYCKKSVGCLRYLVGRRLSGKIIEILSFIRIGTKESGSVENYNAGGILSYVHDGYFEGGHILDNKTNEDRLIMHHPDNNLPIKGEIPYWDKVRRIAREVAIQMPQLNYMGIDFCITDKDEVKMLEINSLSSLDAMQLETSIYETPAGDFFKERLCNG